MISPPPNGPNPMPYSNHIGRHPNRPPPVLHPHNPTMAFIVYITETSAGRATFETKEEAEEFVREPDYDLVKWYDTLDADTRIVEE